MAHEGIPESAKILAAILSSGISLSYPMLTNYLDIGSLQETVLVTIVVGFLLGTTTHDMKSLLFAILSATIIAFVITSCLVAYSVFLPFIKLGEISYLHVVYVAAVSVIDKIFIVIFFFFIFFLFSGMLGVFLS